MVLLNIKLIEARDVLKSGPFVITPLHSHVFILNISITPTSLDHYHNKLLYNIVLYFENLSSWHTHHQSNSLVKLQPQ